MKRALAPALLAALVLTGCATTTVARDDAAIDAARALALVQTATRSSLAEAAQLLAGKAVAAPTAPAIASTGRALYGILYPELATPFPDGPAVTIDERTSPFLARILPIVAALHPVSSVDATTAARMRDDIETVAYLAPDSVLPPYLEATLVLGAGGAAAEARGLFEEALRRSPDFYPAARGIIGIIIDGGGAAREIDRLVELAGLLPAPSERNLARTRAYLAARIWDKAADAAAQGLLASPDDARFALLRAEAMASSGDWYVALRILENLRKLAPGDPSALLLEARLLSEKENNDDEALDVLDSAGPELSASADILELRGAVLLRMRRLDESAAALTKALDASPGRVTTLSLLLENAVEAGQWEQALTWVAQIPEASRGPADLRNAWVAATQRGDDGQATAFARSLAEKSPGPDAQLLEARSLVAAGRGSDAAAVIASALGSSTDNGQRSELYLLRSHTGTTDPSDDLRLSLLENPDNLEALTALADLLATQGDLRKALEYARRAAVIAPDDPTVSERVHDIEARAAGR